MKRPILVAVIGYIIGIIWGLYFKFSIALLYSFIYLIIAIINCLKKRFYKKKKFNFLSIKRYLRYIKLVLNKKVILIIILSSIISNSIIIFKNYQFENLYKNIESIEVIANVYDVIEEKNYKNIYKIKVKVVNKLNISNENLNKQNEKTKGINNKSINNNKKYNGTYLYLETSKKVKLKCGDKIKVYGYYKEADTKRNYGGFDYKEYLKQLNIYGTIKSEKVEVLENNNGKKVDILNKIKEIIKNNAEKILDKDSYSIFLGLILGDTALINDEVKEDLKNSNISHILAVSGMHMSYIILGVTILLNQITGKKISKIFTIFILILYVSITGFSPSIIRAAIMGIMVLIASLIHRKNDIWISISLSLFIILIYNPYSIENMGLQFSYLGTIRNNFVQQNDFMHFE